MTDTTLETKAGGSADERLAFDELHQAFAAFKDTNEERLEALERHSADALIDDKLERLSQVIDNQQHKLDELTLKAVRPPLGGDRASTAAASAASLQHKSAFNRYVRAGESEALRGLESVDITFTAAS